MRDYDYDKSPEKCIHIYKFKWKQVCWPITWWQFDRLALNTTSRSSCHHHFKASNQYLLRFKASSLFHALVSASINGSQWRTSAGEQSNTESRTKPWWLIKQDCVAFVGQGMFSKSRFLPLAQMGVLLVLINTDVRAAFCSPDISPVSYTHLDVYKRQG